jgi:Tol biopolymer transport system component
VHLHLADVESGNVRRLTSGAFSVWTMSWSPDGKSIAFPLCRGVDEGYDCEILVAPL